MPINTRPSYIELGTAVNDDYTLANSLSLPAPNELAASDEFSADAERNANNTMILQQVGRMQYVPQFTWNALKNDIWWQLNRWLRDYGVVFYVKQFKHTTGEIIISRHYRGNMNKASASKTTEVKNGIVVPTHYLNCSVNLIDMGEDDVIVIGSAL